MKRFPVITGLKHVWTRTALSAALALALGTAVPAAALADDAATATANASAEQKDRSSVLNLLSELHVSGTPRSALEPLTISGMIDYLKDPYTVYFNEEQLQSFTNFLEQNFVGVGAVVGIDETGVYVERVLPGSPAESAGILQDDYIVAVDGVKTGNSADEDVNKIRGKEGTTVQISVKRGADTKTFTVTRKQIQLPAVSSGLFQPNVGYLRVTDFSSEAGDQFASQLGTLLNKGAGSLVIDLRDNPGGLLDSALTMAKQFIASGVLIHTKDRNNEDKPVEITGGTKRELPVTVLVNENSASASEVLTGALRDYGIAKVVGTKTFGKGSVQEIFSLPSGGALKVTVQEYLTPKLTKVNKVGLQPDIPVEGYTAQLLTALHTAGLKELNLKADPHRLTVNGLAVDDGLKVLRREGHVYAPTRAVTALLNGKVTWNETSRSVDIDVNGKQADYSEASHELILQDGSSFVSLDAARSAFPDLTYSDANGTLSLAATIK
jgi:carboxyl-terminal processing protease